MWHDRDRRRQILQLVRDLLLLVALTLLFRSTLALAAGSDASCANTGVGTSVYQPNAGELSTALEAAANNTLGPNYEPMPSIWAGYPNQTLVPGTEPCVILKAIAYVESSWHQADYSVPPGSSGLPLISGSCGYGIMQITSPMRSPGLIDPTKQQRIAGDYRFNVSYGAKMLADKWNTTPIIGNNNPNVLEDWYYAVWAYNSWWPWNNPNDYNPSRPAFNGTQPRQNYPYQELIWGFAAYPQLIDGATRWSSTPITLPSSSVTALWAARAPRTGDMAVDPTPTHTNTCSSPPPLPIIKRVFVPILWKW